MIESTEELYLPQVYTGGYLYPAEVTGHLNGVPIPQSERSVKEWVDRWEEARKLLREAPKGSEYIVVMHPDGMQSYCRHSYKKVSEDEWEIISIDFDD